MAANRSVTGMRSRNTGAYFEGMMTAACRYYQDKEVAIIEKTPEPMKPLKPYGDRRRGQFIAVYEKQAQPDFKGVLLNGRGIIFDAKHTDSDRIAQSVVTTTQEEHFEKYTGMGAICFVMVSIGFERFYRVPWKVFSEMKQRYGRKYMKCEELEPFSVPYRRGVVLFLEGLDIDEGLPE